MNLVEAIDPVVPAKIAIVGAGGKTTTLFQLGKLLPGQVWLSTTTHLGTDQMTGADSHFIVKSISQDQISDWLKQKSTLLTGDFTPDDRVKGPDENLLEEIMQAAEHHRVSMVIEADGSRSRPLKAPGENEPATPQWVDTVITVVGLSVLGQEFSENTVHRVEPFKKITGLDLGEKITIHDIARLLSSPAGGLKNSPIQAKKIVVFNQADSVELKDEASSIASDLLSAGFDRVIIGALKNAPNELICIKNA